MERNNLLYVAVSRAKQRLVIYEDGNWAGQNRPPQLNESPKPFVLKSFAGVVPEVTKVQRAAKRFAINGALTYEQFETYVRCPLQYWYRFGIGLRREQEPDVAVRARFAVMAALRTVAIGHGSKPQDPDLYKIGVTILSPEKRLAQHNSQFDKYAGQVVKETGQKWEIKEVVAVPDPYLAEKVFWGATPLADIPFRGGIEVGKMEWGWVQAGLNAAKKAGLRPPPVPRTMSAHHRELLTQLEGTGITIVGRYRGIIRGTDFRCEKGHEFTESAGVVAYRKSCPLCGPDYRAPWRRAAPSR